MIIVEKGKTLEPNEWGNMLCPYHDDGYVLTPIMREWMNPPHIDYFCHRCKIMFKTKVKGGIYDR